MVGTSLKIPGTKRIVKESINAVHHTPRGTAVWINFDPPPSKDYDIWIKGDCQKIPEIYAEYERTCALEKALKAEEMNHKRDERLRIKQERLAKREVEALRKEENRRVREQRRLVKEMDKRARMRKAGECGQRNTKGSSEVGGKILEHHIGPINQISADDRIRNRPAAHTLLFDSESTLTSPSLSDLEFNSFVGSRSESSLPKTPTTTRVRYLPTPTPTPHKRSRDYAEPESPSVCKKVKGGGIGATGLIDETVRDSIDNMSIKFLTDSD